MIVRTVMYHDVVEADFDSSGFPGSAAARFKIKVDDFSRHLDAIASIPRLPVLTYDELDPSSEEVPIMITVDDGGVSSMRIADLLEERGWRAHFFVTSDFVGQPGFLDENNVRELATRGHKIGSHSCSHPYRINSLDDVAQFEEWNVSRQKLSEIVGYPITIGSVPGGFYSHSVARNAERAGLRHLFTSEPNSNVFNQGRCRVYGRSNIDGRTTLRSVQRIVTGAISETIKARAVWETKKCVKKIVGPAWDLARDIAFQRTAAKQL